MAFEIQCYRRLMGISWRHQITNEAVKQKIRDQSVQRKPMVLVIPPGGRVHLHMMVLWKVYKAQQEHGSQTLQSGQGLGLQQV